MPLWPGQSMLGRVLASRPWDAHVNAAREQARARLIATAREPVPPELSATVGLPTPATAEHLIGTLSLCFGVEAARALLRRAQRTLTCLLDAVLWDPHLGGE